jgi:hypothetical protein
MALSPRQCILPFYQSGQACEFYLKSAGDITPLRFSFIYAFRYSAMVSGRHPGYFF